MRKTLKLNEKLVNKIQNDRFYSKVFNKYNDLNLLIEAGFINSKIEAKDFYNLDLLTTPVGKILDNIKNATNPIVLLSTGGFSPIHKGHIDMMELAKKELTRRGFDVVGGYFSPSHEDYVSKKPHYKSNLGNRIFQCQKDLEPSSWLMIDPWESLYVKTYINFTSVIDRLEKYLKKHVDKRINVAYVFGGDNAKFNYCFEDDGIGVCVSRSSNDEYFQDAKAEIQNKYCIFIENNLISSKLSSRIIREKKNKPSSFSRPLQGTFIIRNEEMLPFKSLSSVAKEENISAAQKVFLSKLTQLFKQEFGENIDIDTIKVENQLQAAKQSLSAVKTLSLDSYFKGNYNLEISRLFDISSPQFHYLKMIERLGSRSLAYQLSKLPLTNFTLVDDDSVSGSTLKSIKSMLPEEIKIDNTYLLSNMINKNYFDVVDLRDFIIGANNSGLTVRLPNNEAAKCPYMLPYVSLSTRASVAPNNQLDFSINLWKLNLEFYNSLNKIVYLKDVDKSFSILMNYLGFTEKTRITDICRWHIEKLEAAH